MKSVAKSDELDRVGCMDFWSWLRCDPRAIPRVARDDGVADEVDWFVDISVWKSADGKMDFSGEIECERKRTQRRGAEAAEKCGRRVVKSVQIVSTIAATTCCVFGEDS
jgi:hypothetical protein